jgi:hypothetical protein
VVTHCNTERNGTERRRSRLRSIRIAREINDFLENEAEKQGLTFNALVNRILTKYSRWDGFAEKFGFVTIAAESLSSILSRCEDEMLERTGRELGAKMTAATTMFWHMNVDFDALLDMINLYSRYSGQYTAETKRSDSEVTLTFHHNLGEKWSIILKNFIEASVNSVLPKSETRSSYTGNLVVAHATLPSNYVSKVKSMILHSEETY